MNRTYVALDLETTGLDPDRDAILEIGVVRFRTSLDGGHITGRVLDKWSTLINPGRPIPLHIQQITGITEQDVRRAPRFSQIIGRLRRFVGHYPIVGHNIGFDMGFLQSHRLTLSNPTVDTFELASILMPHANRYSLIKLGESFDLDDQGTHRALDDALAAQSLFIALLEHAADLPRAILAELNRLAANVDWPLKEVFRDIERSQARSAFRGGIGQQLAAALGTSEDALGPLFTTEEQDEPPLKPAARPRALDVDELAAMLEEGGLFAQHFPGFEHRPQQVEMLRAVAQALNRGRHLLVEAGTGTGKSIAYLLPAITFAHLNGERVVVSTNTLNLQDQLYLKDVPDLQKLLPFEFRAAVLKGRSNYLCQRRLASLRQVGVSSVDEMRMLAKVLVWLPSTQSGERGELFMPNRTEQALWSRISADSETCTADRCRFRENGRCFFYRARRAAERAHLIIVNHALLLADVAVENRVLPDYRYLIVDEAHHLEDSVTRQLSFQADQRTIERLLNELVRPAGRGYGGFLSDLLTRCRGAISAEDWATLRDHTHGLQKKIEATLTNVYAFFNILGDFLREHGPHRNDYDMRLRLTGALRVQPDWDRVEMTWDNLSSQLHRIITGLESLHATLSDMTDSDIPDIEGLVQDCAGYAGRLADLRHQINACIAEPNGETIYWATLAARDERVTLHAAPLHVGKLVEQHLFRTKEAVILTSATLTTDNRFDFIRERLHAWDADELMLDSPFDYERSTLLYIPVDIPEPNQPYYQKKVEETLIALARASQGRMLVLFTSYYQLRNTSRAISRPLAQEGIVVYQQGAGTGRAQLLENFRTTPRAVLLGTRSFWEGIDVTGEALSVLVITRLPFSVPNDPIFAARSETFENPFAQYAIPETILRFRQGFGRLIRTKNDRGVVVILDKRVLTKSYGPMFLNSLPKCTRYRASLAKLPEATRRWLADDWPR